MSIRPPLTDAIMIALAKLVADAQSGTREPSHYDLSTLFTRVGLKAIEDQLGGGKPMGKSKRVRAVLGWALENRLQAGEEVVAGLISIVRGYGGFRPQSSNYCGAEAIDNLAAAFSGHGWQLSRDGDLSPVVLESLRGRELTAALESYARRAQRGALDSPLLAGTAKDLLEATAAHVLMEKWGNYPSHSNFPTLLGQAFIALGLATSHDTPQPGEGVEKRVERAAFELGCSLNAMRNKQGTGHGRPWDSTVTAGQARFAIESMGNIAAMLLDRL